MTTQLRKNAREFHVSLWGLGLLFGALIVTLRPNNLAWIPGEEVGLSWFTGGFTIGLILLGIVGSISCIRFHQFLVGLERSSHNKVLIVASICLIAAQIYLGYYSLSLDSLNAITGLIGFIASIGTLGLGMLWFLVFRADSTDHILVNSAAALVVAATASFVFFLIPSVYQQMIGAILLTTISSWLLYRAQKVSETHGFTEELAINCSSKPSESATELKPSPQPTFALLGRAYSNVWLPLVGAMISCFIQGLVWNPVLSETTRSSNAFSEFTATILGASIVLVTVILTNKAKPGLGALPRFIQFGCPIAMAILLVHPFVAPNEGVVGDLGNSVGQAAFYATALFLWAGTTASSNNGSLSPLAFYFPSIAALALAYGSGFFLIHILGIGGKDVCLVLSTIFLVLYSFSLIQANQTEKHGRIADEIRPDQFIHKRCDELAQEFSISPRETEVLYYLGRGYNHGYIARKLFLSENTVRTHVRHIYAKLNISSREELLNLIDENDIENES